MFWVTFKENFKFVFGVLKDKVGFFLQIKF